MPTIENQIKAFQNNLAKLLENYGEASALCRATGIKASTLSGYRSGKNVPNLIDALKIAEYFKIPLAELMADPDATDTASCDLRELVIGTHPGKWRKGRILVTLSDPILTALRASRLKNLLLYRVKVSHLYPLISEGEWVIVETGLTPENSEPNPFLVFINGKESCRYLSKDDSGRTVAISVGPKMATDARICQQCAKIEVVGRILISSKWMDGRSVESLKEGFRMMRTERT